MSQLLKIGLEQLLSSIVYNSAIFKNFTIQIYYLIITWTCDKFINFNKVHLLSHKFFGLFYLPT